MSITGLLGIILIVLAILMLVGVVPGGLVGALICGVLGLVLLVAPLRTRF